MHCYIDQVDVAMRLLTVALVALAGAIVIAETVSGPVERVRVERFARRQRLTVTPENGNQIIRYLATTRRWRAAGLTAGLVLSIGLHVPTLLRFDFVTLFAGWFAGALVAEARVAHLGAGPRRAASLQRRVPSSYLPRVDWALVPAAGGVAAAVGAGTGVLAAIGAARPSWTAWLWLVVALGVATAVRSVQYLVLRRPQPLAAPAVLAADDAIRSRSLHVLAGGGMALVALCVPAQLGAMAPTAEDVAEGITVLRTVGVFVIAAIGWGIATSPWPRGRAGAFTGVTRTGPA
jgi:hypothetical protein